MITKLKDIIIAVLMMIVISIGGNARGQLDNRFGAKGVEGTKYLGQNGLNWYRDWQDSYLPGNYPPAGKNKIWTVGKIDYRTDDLGMDYRWIVLDLLEDTDVDFLQNFLNLCIALIDTSIIPTIDDYWVKNRPLLEAQLKDILDNFVYTEKKYGIKYRAKTKNANIAFQDELPEFVITVKEDNIIVTTSLSADWMTHIYIEAWVLNPNPFHWGYIWKNIGDADCKFQTTIHLSASIALEGHGRDRHLRIQNIVADSRTESNIDWSMLGISFSWETLSNTIEDRVDKEIESQVQKEFNKEPITNPYYFVDFFKSLFSGGIVPTQQEILDRIWNGEQGYIRKVIEKEGYEGGYWSIGYEPNWYPMLRPSQYADFFVKYYQLIKELDPSARVMGPAIFLTDAVKDFGEIAWLFIPEFFQGPLIGIKDEFKGVIDSYFKMADSKDWYNEFINLLPPGVRVDINDFHVFPVNADVQIINWDSLKYLMDDMAVFMKNVGHTDEVWVSEFGNIDRKRSEAEVADMCQNFCQYFKSNTVGIERWFWFLARGHSPFYDIPFAPKPPVTALLNNDFKLTQVGKAYLYEADCTPPITDSAPTDDGKDARPGKIFFHWQEAKEYDTGIADYQLQVRSEPGNNIIFNEWVGTVLYYSVTSYGGQTLFARVQAKNGAGLIGEWSGWSDGISIRYPDLTDSKVTDNLDAEKMENGPPLPGDTSKIDQKLHQKTNDFQQISNLEATSVEIPNSFVLSQNYPNPFNAATTINYQLPEDARVLIKIYNARGEEIRALVEEFKTAAYYSVQWNGRDNYGNPVSSGVYLYRIVAGNHVDTKKMVFVE